MNDQPSALAIKLAARFAPKVPDAAKDIDNLIQWHGQDERERIRQANKLLPGFCENTRVFANANRNEFFELQLLPAEPRMEYEVMFKRYAVPGRYWIYAFYFEREGSGRVVYGAESDDSITKSLKMLATDLDKPQVVDLFKQAFSAKRVALRYRQETLRLLKMLAPKSKSYRVAKKLSDKALEDKRARIETAKVKEGV